MDWKIETYDANGVLKQTYTNNSPGGVVSKILYSLEPSGNCLDASFDAIPNQMDIAPRDFAKIYIDNMVTPKWYGYFRSHFNPDSSKVTTYNLEGAKKLVFDYFVETFFFSPSTGLVGDESNLVPHNAIVDALESKLPNFVQASIDNQASPTTGNMPPIIASNYSMGSIFDDISMSAADDDYVWGVDGTGQLFIKPENSTTLDLSIEPDKRVEYRGQGTDKTVTAIKYAFTNLSSFKFPLEPDSNKRIVDAGEYTTTGSFTGYTSLEKNDFSPALLTYKYADSSLVSQYGEFIKMQPLPLSDSWTDAYTTAEVAALNPPFQRVLVSAEQTGTWVTNTGSTDGNLFKDILVDGAGGYVRNDSPELSDGYVRLDFQIDRGTGNAIINVDGFIGIKIRYKILTPGLFRSMSYTYEYDNYSIATQTVGAPRFDTVQVWEEDLENGLEVNQLFATPPRSIGDYRVNPESLNSDGRPFNTLQNFQFSIWFDRTDGTEIQPDSVRIYEIKPIFLNDSLLDNIGARLMKTPADYPSTVKIQSVGSLAGNITVDTPGGTNKTELVRRISYELSRERGLETTYELGADEQMDNTVFERIYAQDDKTKWETVSTVNGQA